MRFAFADRCALVSLKGHEAFDGVFQHGRRFAHRGITGFVRFRLHNDDLQANPKQASPKQAHHKQTSPTMIEKIDDRQLRPTEDVCCLHFGVTAKKRTRPAVLRNRIKRLLRESLRSAFQQMSAKQRKEAFAAIDSIVLICNAIPERAAMIGLEHTLYPVQRIINDALKSQHRPQPTIPNQSSNVPQTTALQTSALQTAPPSVPYHSTVS